MTVSKMGDFVQLRISPKQPLAKFGSWRKVDCFKAYEVGYLHAAITNSHCCKYLTCQIELHKSAPLEYKCQVQIGIPRCSWGVPKDAVGSQFLVFWK